MQAYSFSYLFTFRYFVRNTEQFNSGESSVVDSEDYRRDRTLIQFITIPEMQHNNVS